MEIPMYKTHAGQILPDKSMGNDLQRYITNTTIEECMEYVQMLLQQGFVLHTEKRITVEKTLPLVNLFYTCVREDMHLFIFYEASLLSARIVAAAPSPIPSSHREPSVTEGQKRAVTSLSQISVNGMCYVIQLSDGRFVMIDGGTPNDEDERRLFAFLQAHTQENEKPIIALWMFSHADVDHIALACSFITRYGNQVIIEAFAYQFPDFSKIDITMDCTAEKKDIESLEESIRMNHPMAEVYTLRTGQSYFFDEVEIEILFTANDTYPMIYTSQNDLSAAWRMKFANGKKALFLGDCMVRGCRRIAHMYGDYLKSDIMQVTHHGLIGGDRYLYEQVDPDICLWPVPERRFSGKLAGQRYQWCIGEGGCDYNRWLRDSSIRKREHYHHGEDITIYFNETVDGGVADLV